jgi:hypothetical protein
LAASCLEWFATEEEEEEEEEEEDNKTSQRGGKHQNKRANPAFPQTPNARPQGQNPKQPIPLRHKVQNLLLLTATLTRRERNPGTHRPRARHVVPHRLHFQVLQKLCAPHPQARGGLQFRYILSNFVFGF